MAIKDTHGYDYDYRSKSSANIDANYGPWTSIDGNEETSYQSWRIAYGLNNTPIKEGTQIAIKPNASSEVTLKIYSKGVWKDVGGDMSTLDFVLSDTGEEVGTDEKYVICNDSQGLTDAEKTMARSNIGAASQDDVTTALNNSVKTATDQAIGGTKTFTGGIIVNECPNGAVFNGDTVVNGQLKYKKSNPNASGIQEGVLMRDSNGNVYSQALNATSVLYANSAAEAENAEVAEQAVKDASGNVITTTYATKSELGDYLTDSDIANTLTSLTFTKDTNTNSYIVTGTTSAGTPVSFSSGTIELPQASVIVDAEWNSTDECIDLIIDGQQNPVQIPVGDFVNGLQPLISQDNKLSAALVSGLADVARTGSYSDLTDAPAINDNATSQTGLYSSSKIANTFAQKATTLAGYGIADAKIEENSTTHVKTITLGNATMNPVEINNANTTDYSVFSSNKMIETFASKGRVDNMEAKLAGNVVWGYPGYAGGASQPTFEALEASISAAGNFASNITLKYVPSANGAVFYLKYASGAMGSAHYFSCMYMDYTSGKASCYVAMVRKVRQGSDYVAEWTINNHILS